MWDAAREARLIRPTLLIDVPDDAEITREEIFGPMLTIHPYDDLAEAIAFVNDRPAALAAYWYGEDGDDTAGIDPAITGGGAAGITSEEIMAQYVATEARVDRMRDKYALEGRAYPGAFRWWRAPPGARRAGVHC
ncbi:aldehyde dehydrogenase family protein [Streptomyces lincolnensis]|uniref:aldehyde dehydrogenase family protein n=1 Tax=Streptomyces lincolnensis TaxID=1915 RepID=UPI0037D1D01D